MFIVCHHRTACPHMHSGATTAYPYGYRASVRSVVSRLTAPCPPSRARPPRLRRAVPSLRYKREGATRESPSIELLPPPAFFRCWARAQRARAARHRRAAGAPARRRRAALSAASYVPSWDSHFGAIFADPGDRGRRPRPCTAPPRTTQGPRVARDYGESADFCFDSDQTAKFRRGRGASPLHPPSPLSVSLSLVSRRHARARRTD